MIDHEDDMIGHVRNVSLNPPPGHYISEGAYPEEGNNLADQWLRYNDLKVSRTTGRAVCRRRQRTAYLLFYQRQVGGRIKSHSKGTKTDNLDSSRPCFKSKSGRLAIIYAQLIKLPF